MGGGDDCDKEGEEDEAGLLDYQPSDNVIKLRSMDWIERVVVGLNFCPFAERLLREGRLKVTVARGDDGERVTTAVSYELGVRSVLSRLTTPVVVAPEYHPDDFERCMSLVQYVANNVKVVHLHVLVQILSFHPMFEFTDSGKEGVDKYTNRSPNLMFHILSEDEVEAAVNKLGRDTSKV